MTPVGSHEPKAQRTVRQRPPPRAEALCETFVLNDDDINTCFGCGWDYDEHDDRETVKQVAESLLKELLGTMGDLAHYRRDSRESTERWKKMVKESYERRIAEAK